jgi:hypothetical protein
LAAVPSMIALRWPGVRRITFGLRDSAAAAARRRLIGVIGMVRTVWLTIDFLS